MRTISTGQKGSPHAAQRWPGVLTGFFSLCLTPAHADEVRVLSAGAAEHAVQAIAPAFFEATGHTLVQSLDTAGAQSDRVPQAAPGSVADIVILSDAALVTAQFIRFLAEPQNMRAFAKSGFMAATEN